jgi:hypothetical protein
VRIGKLNGSARICGWAHVGQRSGGHWKMYDQVSSKELDLACEYMREDVEGEGTCEEKSSA